MPGDQSAEVQGRGSTFGLFLPYLPILAQAGVKAAVPAAAKTSWASDTCFTTLDATTRKDIQCELSSAWPCPLVQASVAMTSPFRQ